MKATPIHIIVILFLLASACNYFDTGDDAGWDRGRCWDYRQERHLRWDTPTHRGPTPAEAMATHASPARVSGVLDEWLGGADPTFDFTFDSDIESDCRELGWANWGVVPDHCRGNWELVLPTTGHLTIDHASLPSVSGPGWVSIEDDGTELTCLSVLDVRLDDEGAFVAWFDFVEHNMAMARPQRVDVFIRSRCDGSEGEVHIGYEALAEPEDTAGGQYFYFENRGEE